MFKGAAGGEGVQGFSFVEMGDALDADGSGQ